MYKNSMEAMQIIHIYEQENYSSFNFFGRSARNGRQAFAGRFFKPRDLKRAPSTAQSLAQEFPFLKKT